MEEMDSRGNNSEGRSSTSGGQATWGTQAKFRHKYVCLHQAMLAWNAYSMCVLWF